jgi:hypothetical protein
MTLYRRLAVLFGAVLVIFGVVLQLPAWSDTASTTSTTSTTPGFTASQTITRDNVDASGADDVIDTRNFSVSVDRNTNLRGNQQLQVSWSGAHPTGGNVPDESSSEAAQFEEYPVVLMECRGTDAAGAPAADKLDPTTCWTQTTYERYNADYSSPFPPWRLDRYETAANRTAHPGQPTPLNDLCTSDSTTLASRWVPFVADDGTVYNPGYIPFAGCPSPLPPEAPASNVENTSAPGNTTYAVTDSQGNGQLKFVVWSADQNGSLGCSDTVACSLVIIPIMGVSCAQPLAAGETAADDAACSSTGIYAPGAIINPADSDPAVTGQFWWTASNWRNRVSVPLTFAQSSSVCSVVNNSNPVLLYGSPPMAEATEQWAPYFCTNPNLFTFRHVQTGEPSVKNLLGLGLSTTPSGDTSSGSPVASATASASSTSSPVSSYTSGGSTPDTATASNGIEAVLESDAPPTGYLQPTIQAPIALTGFAISYVIDDPSGHVYNSLQLNPRLLAKLLTESYPDIPAIYNSYPPLANNPRDITHDPEFLALNPGLASLPILEDAASTLYTLSSNADTMFALTSYINADPEARAWLDGQPDPWGMVVNPNYKGISLPVESWPLLDSFEIDTGGGGNNPCLDANPTPYLPLVASPTSTLSAIAQAIQFSAPLSQTDCVTSGGATSLGDKLTTGPRQAPGLRFMMGLTSLGDAAYYGLNTAALQTYALSPNPTSRFTSDVGRTFASPTDASLIAAAELASPDQSTGTWPIPYDALRNDPGNSGAYPGTMFVYMVVPAAGLPAQDAADFATFMRFAITSGQTPGFGNGELPPGYAPMTTKDGLADQVDYTLRAASAVASQHGIVPPLTGDVEASLSAPPPASSPASSAPPAATVPPVTAPTVGAPAPVAPRGPTAPSSQAAAPTVTSESSSVGPAQSSATSSAAAIFTGKTVASTSTLAGSALPSVLAIGLGGLFIASGLRFRLGRKR